MLPLWFSRYKSGLYETRDTRRKREQQKKTGRREERLRTPSKKPLYEAFSGGGNAGGTSETASEGRRHFGDLPG